MCVAAVRGAVARSQTAGSKAEAAVLADGIAAMPNYARMEGILEIACGERGMRGAG
jgi:hypothetical protein